MNQLEKYKRTAIYAKLKGFCPYAKDDHYIEVTMWSNGEGFDVDIESELGVRFHLTWGEYKALKKLIKEIEK